MSESKGPLFNGQDFDTWWDAIEDEHDWDEFLQTSLARLVWNHCAASRDAEIERLRAEVYHTAPGELDFGGEGWTWKQQARANEDRLRELEAEVARLGGVVAAAVQAEQAARERVTVLDATIDKCRAAGFLTPEGEARKVLGKLPLTADGCVFGVDAPTVYAIYSDKVVGAACSAESNPCDECGNDNLFSAFECYSTREAAEAARNTPSGKAAAREA